MPCFHPLDGYKSSTGKWISEKTHHLQEQLTIPCGKCTGCRTEYSRQWAIRIAHEEQWWKKKDKYSTFITLTYNDKWLPPHNTLIKEDFQKFMKRLRKKKHSTKDNPLRFYACGEYGEKNERPHYHAILFNCSFKKDADISNGKNKLYFSQELQDAWSHYDKKTETYEPIGFVSWGEVTFDSAAYVANYVQKKINGKKKDEHYQIENPVCPKTGEYRTHRQQEFSLMSRKPGIASDWLTHYKDDVYPSDYITINGRKIRPPKAYDKIYERTHKQELEAIKEIRKQEMEKTAHLRTPEALAFQERTHKAKMALYKRNKL